MGLQKFSFLRCLLHWFCKAALWAWTIPLTPSPSVCIAANCPIIPFSTGCWILSRRARSDYNNSCILCHLPTVACINSISLAQCTHLLFPEPNAYRSLVGRAVNSTQLAQDYTKLRTLLQSVRYYHRAHLYGPNAGRPRKNAILLLDGWVSK